MMTIDYEDVSKKWKEYLKSLYTCREIRKESKTVCLADEESVEVDIKGLPIIRSEFDAALENLKGKKATGIGDIPIEILKNLRNSTIN